MVPLVTGATMLRARVPSSLPPGLVLLVHPLAPPTVTGHFYPAFCVELLIAGIFCENELPLKNNVLHISIHSF